MANENKMQDVIATSLQNIKNLIDTNTVIGTPIVANGTTIIPISKVSMAYATGGLDYAGKTDPSKEPKNFGAGGGTASVNAIPAVEKLVAKLSGDEKTGASIIVKALQAPVRQIAENAGVDGSVVFEKIKNSRKVGFGYNAYSATYCDMIPAGIVDPTKVTRTALENAASIGACVLTTESIVADKPDPAADAAAAAAANAGGMGGMY